MRSGRPSAIVVLGVVLVTALALAHRDEVRARAERALGSGMPAREAALARGFVLGEDDRIDPATVEDFRRAGLSHLLAVSGQNVALLALLVMPLLAALGMPLRTRLVWVIAAIAVYVPLAGGGPSIVRAGVMGVITLLATLSGRRSSRLFALAVAAIATLALDPGIGADIGWQLSFAAVLGILALARPLRRAIVSRIGSRGPRGALAEGIAVTVAATLATAPLIAFHFGEFSTVSLLANLLALPAVAPAMWLGMLSSIGAQVPGFPAAAPNAIAAPLLAYIATVASWCGKPGWAFLEVKIGMRGLIASYVALAGAAIATPALAHRRRITALRRRRSPLAATPCNESRLSRIRKALHRHRRWAPPVAAGAVLLAAIALVYLGAGSESHTAGAAGLRIVILDVGQGDAILLQPAKAPPVLIDGGPPGDELVAKLHEAGVDSLGAAVLTHEQSDHAGGIRELLERHYPIGRLLYARLGGQLRSGEDRGRRPSQGRGGRFTPGRSPAAQRPLAATRAARPAARGRRPKLPGPRPARALEMVLDAAHRRCRGRGSAD
jgi:competence protein ComEC